MDPIDVSQFVQFRPAVAPTSYRILRPGRRGYQVGTLVGVIGFKHASGYEVLLKFPDGKIESFIPHDCAPVVPDPSVSDRPCTIAA